MTSFQPSATVTDALQRPPFRKPDAVDGWHPVIVAWRHLWWPRRWANYEPSIEDGVGANRLPAGSRAPLGLGRGPESYHCPASRDDPSLSA
jgi:hypothetical protein